MERLHALCTHTEELVDDHESPYIGAPLTLVEITDAAPAIGVSVICQLSSAIGNGTCPFHCTQAKITKLPKPPENKFIYTITPDPLIEPTS